MKQEGNLEVFRYVQFVLVVVVLKVFACLLLVAMLLTATSLIDPLVTVLSLPKLAIALVAISEIFLFIVSFWFFSVLSFFPVHVLMFGYECFDSRGEKEVNLNLDSSSSVKGRKKRRISVLGLSLLLIFCL